MTDPIGALVAILKATAAVNDPAGGRVYGGDLPATQAQHMPRRAVVVHPSGIPGLIGGGYQRYGDQSVEITCYGQTIHDAYSLYLPVKETLLRLRRQVQGGVLLHWTVERGGFGSGREPDTDWPIHESAWTVAFAHVALS